MFARDVTLDAAGNVYVADGRTLSIRKVNVLTGVISTVAGNGDRVSSGDGGPTTLAGMNPTHVFVAPNGDLYINTQLLCSLPRPTRPRN